MLRICNHLFVLLVCIAGLILNSSPVTAQRATPAAENPTLLVTNAASNYLSLIDPGKGVIGKIEVSASPWGLALARDNRVYVSTAQGVSVVDLRQRKQMAFISYRAKIGTPQYGEYRPGGMGIALSPDKPEVYVGIYLSNGASQVEIIDTDKLTVTAVVPVGIRPFDVLASRDGREVYSLDHDSYTITVIDTATRKTRVIPVAPLGRGSFDKPHYAAIASDGQLWLPYQGRTLIRLDPASGKFTSTPLTANTHQHGITFTPDGRSLLIVGTGAAGGATQGPSLTMVDTQTMQETILPLARPHEKIAVSLDGRHAYLTGGYLLPGGWDGITVINLQDRTVTELAVADRPLDIVVLPSQP